MQNYLLVVNNQYLTCYNDIKLSLDLQFCIGQAVHLTVQWTTALHQTFKVSQFFQNKESSERERVAMEIDDREAGEIAGGWVISAMM